MESLGYAHRAIGKGKTRNDDFCLADNKLRLYIVSDGTSVGQGHKASELAVTGIQKVVISQKKLIDEYNHSPSKQGLEKIKDLLDTAVQSVSSEIYQRKLSDKEWANTISTISLLLVLKNCSIIGNLGNSRVYHLASGRIQKLTNDNSTFEEASAAEKEQFSKYKTLIRNPKKDLSKALGLQNFAPIRFEVRSLVAGDTFLISSDGFHETFSSDDVLCEVIDRLISKTDFQGVPRMAIEYVLSKNQKDDASVVLVRVEDPTSPAVKGAQTDAVRKQLVVLSKLSVLSEIASDESSLRKIHALFQSHSCQKGRPLVSQGDKSDSMHIIVSGNTNLISDGKEDGQRGPGDLIGEMGFFTDLPRSATVIPTVDTQTLVLWKKDYNDLIVKDKELALRINHGVIKALVKKLLEERAKRKG